MLQNGRVTAFAVSAFTQKGSGREGVGGVKLPLLPQPLVDMYLQSILLEIIFVVFVLEEHATLLPVLNLNTLLLIYALTIDFIVSNCSRFCLNASFAASIVGHWSSVLEK